MHGRGEIMPRYKRVLDRYEVWLAGRAGARPFSEQRRLLRADEIFEACLRSLDYRALAVLGERYGNGTRSEYAQVAHDLRVMLDVIGDEREEENMI